MSKCKRSNQAKYCLQEAKYCLQEMKPFIRTQDKDLGLSGGYTALMQAADSLAWR